MSAANSVMNLLRELPHLISLHGKSFAQPESFAFSGLEGGLPKGALVEISGSAGGGKTEVVLRFLSQNPSVRVAWVESESTIYPCAFPQNRVALERVLFVDSPAGDELWTVHQMLRSGVFGVIVLKMGQADADEMTLRRLQLAAEKAQATVVLLTDAPARKGTWPISVQLQASRTCMRPYAGPAGPAVAPGDFGIVLQVLKYRGQKSWQLNIS